MTTGDSACHRGLMCWGVVRGEGVRGHRTGRAFGRGFPYPPPSGPRDARERVTSTTREVRPSPRALRRLRRRFFFLLSRAFQATWSGPRQRRTICTTNLIPFYSGEYCYRTRIAHELASLTESNVFSHFRAQHVATAAQIYVRRCSKRVAGFSEDAFHRQKEKKRSKRERAGRKETRFSRRRPYRPREDNLAKDDERKCR